MSKKSTTTRTESCQKIQVSIIHSQSYTNILHKQMSFIHQDREILLSYLLYYCGFIKQTPKFFHVIHTPMIAKRCHLEEFHDGYYLDLLEYNDDDDNDHYNYNDDVQQQQQQQQEIENCMDIDNNVNIDGNNNNNHKHSSSSSSSYSSHQYNHQPLHTILEKYGLVDDCPIPTTKTGKKQLWEYCTSIVGASIHATTMLIKNQSDVTINFGGGRHHAYHNKAGGFCYVNDIVISIQRMIGCHRRYYDYHHHDQQQIQQQLLQSELNLTQGSKKRVLYLDLDIHHCDGVQHAFYNTDQVLTISLHRYTPGFFPSTTGSIHEKGKYKTNGVGYNLNVPLPRSCSNVDFVCICKRILTLILPEYDPDYVVVCVGADGLRNDDLVKETYEGWDLTPEGLAECVRLIAFECSGNEVEGVTTDCGESNNNGIDTNIHSSRSEVISNNENSRKQINRRRKRRKLLILGGGGYNPANTARTYLLCTAAACEGARPGMLNELPTDVPQHTYFSRYGPSFELYSQRIFDTLRMNDSDSILANASKGEDEYSVTLKEAIETIDLTHMFLKNRNKRERETDGKFFCSLDNIEGWSEESATNVKVGGSRRRRKKVVHL